MGSVTLSCEADVACWSSGIAAGGGDHLPVGYWSTAKYRSAMRFTLPAWGAWTSIVSATLSFSISDHNHVGVKNSAIYIRRTATGSPWTKAEGTQDCESGFSGSNTTQYDDIAGATTNQSSFTSGTTANARKTVTVTELVKVYWAYNQKPVFVFDPVDTDDYTEIWSRTSPSNTYDAKLTINFTDAAPPLAPTLGTPTAAQTIEDTTPTFTWNHVDPDAQTQADIEVYDAAGTTLIASQTLMGAAETLDLTTTLTRGLNYQWRMRTWDAVSGVGAWSGLRTFTLRALPVVTIDATRRMVFANGAPRLVVNWTSDQPQTHYRVQSSAGYDSTWLAGSDVTHVLATQGVVSGTAQTITVSTRSSYGAPALEGSSSRAFTPRYGLTVHRRDLTSAPLNWGSPVIDSIVPADASLIIEYGSSATNTTAPSPAVWYSSLSPVPKARYVFWRAWFVPSAVAGPTLNSIVIPVDSTVTKVDKWGTTRDSDTTLAAPWAIDPGEAVYGTRSMTIDCNGTAQKAYSFGIKVRAGRSYILTGLMKSQGNSGAHFRLEDNVGNILYGGGFSMPPGDVTSDILIATQDWFSSDSKDVNRFKTPVWQADVDRTVYVVLAASGASGTKAWWDAIKLEESTVATPWSPGAIGATVIDAGGVQVDGTRGGIFRYKGITGGARDIVEGSLKGLTFGGDTELTSPSDGLLAADGLTLARLIDIPTAPVVQPSQPGTDASSATIGGLTAIVKFPMTVGGPNLNGGDFLVPTGGDGLYLIYILANISTLGSAGNFRIFLYRNGGSTGGSFWRHISANGAGADYTTMLQLVAGDRIAMYGSGGSGVTGTTQAIGYMNAIRVAAAMV